MEEREVLILHEGWAYWVKPPFHKSNPTKNTWTITPDDPVNNNVPTGKLFKKIKNLAKVQMGFSKDVQMATEYLVEYQNAYPTVLFDTLECTKPCYDHGVPIDVPAPAPKKKSSKRKTNMCYDDFDTNTTDPKTAYLANRLEVASYAVNEQLRKAFALDDDDRPATYTDFIERIKNDKFRIADEAKKEDPYSTNSYRTLPKLKWRAKDADTEGYNAAVAVRDKAHTEASDIIHVMDEKAGLEALKAFESKTFH